MDERSASTGGINVQNVSGTGIIIGENIKTGDININLVYETIRNFGLNLLPSTYFKDNQKTDENFEKWKKGYPLRLPSVMNCLEYRRDGLLEDIKRKLESSENNHRLLILGKPGSSKSTILMEIICDYFKDGYQILYHWENSNKIGNSLDATEFIGKLLNNDNKILIAVDNVHTDDAVGIFQIIRELSSHNKRENLIFILTARTPDYSSVRGSSGGCSTGSSSSSKATTASATVIGETAQVAVSTNNPGAASSSSVGGGQSSCSSTTADHNAASSSSTSPSGGCP